MMRWMLTIATVLLLGVWLASGRWAAGWVSPMGASGRQTAVWLASGGVSAMRHSDAFSAPGVSGVHVVEREAQPPTLPGYHLGWLPAYRTYGSTVRTLFFPLWIPLLLTMGGSAAAWWRHGRRQRRERGGCAACGYDLRGLPAAEGNGKLTCPECGKAGRVATRSGDPAPP